MSLHALQRGAPHMVSRHLLQPPYSQHFGIMRLTRPHQRVPRLNPLHAPFRSAHAVSRPQVLLHTSPSTLFWLLVPLCGGIYTYSREDPPSISSILSSPNIIPRGAPPQLIRIDSPYESQTSLLLQLHEFLRSRIWEPIRTGFRFLHLLAIFIPVILTAPMIVVGPQEDRYGGDRWGAVWWYGLLVKAMQRAGPTFIKLSQWAGSREDLFPAILCDKLGSLHSNGKPHGFAHTRRVIERVFGRAFDEVFEAFEPSPIGVGAIAQVYRATLKSDIHPFAANSASDQVDHLDSPAFTQVPKTSVAIKILHPHVRKQISRDLAILSVFARAIDMMPGLEWLSLPDEVRVFGEMMQQQIDLRHEAHNLVQFEQNFGRDGQGGKSGRVQAAVVFPRPLVNWSTDEVLVEEYADAVPLKYFLRQGGGPFDHRIANLGLDAFLNMLLLDNFVHADLHPGNIMIKFYKPSTRDMFYNFFSSVFNSSGPPLNKYAHAESDLIVAHLRQLAHSPGEWRRALDELEEDGYQPELVFLDAGLVTVLSEKNRHNFLDLFRAIAEFDGYRAGQLMVQRSRSPHLAVDPDVFALRIQHLVLGVKRKTFSLGTIKIADVLYEVLRAVRTHHVRMEADFVNTVISLLLLEGIGRQLDPQMDLLKSSLPILRQLGRQTAARDAVAELPSGNFGAMFKIWVYLEARELASSTVVNLDELVRYDWLSPNV
ncbi:ABC1 family protein C21C3,03, mitochondrial [Rhizoctonia solani]|uniref:ABC1 family protein C21C3,03, mitochondrial n=1 Tax=Rhizoctonia solani TaxID=456999 RepID=A0A0K6FXW0_9AGAM|nr:ABC1 family protein C21C3,03, mitochondrial [Rhizoctonia solani]